MDNNRSRGKEMGSDAKVDEAKDDEAKVDHTEVGGEGTEEEDQDEAKVS